MSYNQAMKHWKSHRRQKTTQPIVHGFQVNKPSIPTQPTPGPWKAQQDCRSYRNEGIFDGNNPDPSGNQNAWGVYGAGSRIALVSEAESWITQEQVNANARLMAASPTLKETLDDIKAKCDDLLGEWAPVAPTFAPASLQGIYEIRDLARDALKSLEES